MVIRNCFSLYKRYLGISVTARMPNALPLVRGVNTVMKSSDDYPFQLVRNNSIGMEGEKQVHSYTVLSVTNESGQTELRNIEINFKLSPFNRGQFYKITNMDICIANLGPAGTKENPILPVSPDGNLVRKINAYRQAVEFDIDNDQDMSPEDLYRYDFQRVEEIMQTFGKTSLNESCPIE